MSLTRVDQLNSNLTSSQIRRSSLIVNLSTTRRKKRSSVTTLFSSSKAGSSNDSLYTSSFSLPFSRRNNKLYHHSQGLEDSCMFDESCSGQIVAAKSSQSRDKSELDDEIVVINKPRSAPATLSKPSYCTTALFSMASRRVDDDNDDDRKSSYHQRSLTNEADTNRFPDNNRQQSNTTMQTTTINPQVYEHVDKDNDNEDNNNNSGSNNNNQAKESERLTKSEQSSRRNSREHNQSSRTSNSPEPLIKVCHTSSSSSANSTGSGHSAASSDCEDSSRKLVRRRTVRRYQTCRSTAIGQDAGGQPIIKRQQHEVIQVDELPLNDNKNKQSSTELTISIEANNSAPFSKNLKDISNNNSTSGIKSHFRTRQIGSYYGKTSEAKQEQQQQQQVQKTSTSSVSSHSTSSKIAKCSTITTNRKSTTSHRQLISESSSSSLSSLSTKKREASDSGDDRTIERRSNNNTSKMLSGSQSALIVEPSNRSPSLFERGLVSTAKDATSLRSIKVQQQEEESSVHRESFSSTTSVRDGRGRSAEVSSSLAHKASASMSTHSSSNINYNGSISTSSSTGLASSHFSSSKVSSAATDLIGSNQDRNRSFVGDNSIEPAPERKLFLNSPDLMFASPDVRLLAKDIGTHFAELENFALISTHPSRSIISSHQNSQQHPLSRGSSSLSSRLFQRRLLPAAVELAESEPEQPSIEPAPSATPSEGGSMSQPSASTSASATASRRQSIIDSCESSLNEYNQPDSNQAGPNSFRIQELLDKARSHAQTQAPASASGLGLDRIEGSQATSEMGGKQTPAASLHQNRCKAAMSESIERIDKRLSDLCRKLNECNDTQEAIGLLKIMIQMIEKAWSVPVCGDDLGFKLCSSLREAGGLETILGFIHDSDEINRLKLTIGADCSDQNTDQNQAEQLLTNSAITIKQQSSAQAKNNSSPNPLRLDLTNLNPDEQTTGQDQANHLASPLTNDRLQAKDSDSDILTSDLGLDSTSVESLSYVSASQMSPQTAAVIPSVVQPDIPTTDNPIDTRKAKEEAEVVDMRVSEEEAENKLKEELVFLSARLLSQCLSSDNRNFIVDNGLDPVIRLACNLTDTKPVVMLGDNGEHADELHASVGTEILQHLFKHSEDTCSQIISLGGLKAILDGCRSSHIDRLRHCASALVNLALYGGPDSQQVMVKMQAHNWLFPLAFNKDDNIQYYACLAIVVLVANQEIEADVLKSSTLNLVEPFVTTHEPRKFAESTTSHIHGQSASWLRKLVPLLESKREEARNLACFHFAMEAYIKREQGQTHVFKEIGALESLRKVGSSPIAIASKFACQALRLIGEKEPHKLSQQVPLWTSEDVIEWVGQIGFEKFTPAFVESRVDGDLLLQLDADMLKNDIGIENGIIRRRFLRELSNLKRIADYSSVDKSGLSSMLSSTGSEFVEYIYPMVQLGVTKDSIHLLDCEQLLNDCRISNTIHKVKLANAIKCIQDRLSAEATIKDSESINGVDQKTLDVFISYRRSTGSQLASLLKVHLQLRNFSVFIDVERLEAGKFDNNLLDSIQSAKNFILVLSPNALDRCIGDHECKDWVHKEIVAALASDCNIIPIIDNFQWPVREQLPEDMRSIIDFNGVRWIHDYQDACVEKVEKFIRGDLSNCAPSNLTGNQAGSSISTGYGGSISGSSNHGSLPRSSHLVGNSGTCSSTPSLIATPSQISFPQSAPKTPANHQYDSEHHPLSFHQAHSMQNSLTTGPRR